MGFGSYDESEQREPEYDEDEASGEADRDLHSKDHDGSLSFESGASTDDLLERLGEFGEDEEE